MSNAYKSVLNELARRIKSLNLDFQIKVNHDTYTNSETLAGRTAYFPRNDYKIELVIDTFLSRKKYSPAGSLFVRVEKWGGWGECSTTHEIVPPLKMNLNGNSDPEEILEKIRDYIEKNMVPVQISPAPKREKPGWLY